MAIPLEELKRQREQIQQHLDWLDAKIAESEHIEPQAEVDEAIAPLASEPPQVEISSDLEPQKETEPVLPPEIDEPAYKANIQNDIKRAQIGCLVIFILGTLLFLFLLFGLPYLL